MEKRWIGIEELVAIADAGSFVGAARRLNRSPSHISRSIAHIEERLSTRLFQRTTRSVRLTEVGKSMVERCRRIIEEREEVMTTATTTGDMSGEIKVTCSITLGAMFIGQIVRENLVENPDLSFQLEFSNRIVDLGGESFDLAIRTGHPTDERVAARQIAARSIVTVASREYIALRGAPDHPDDLKHHDCLVGTSSTWRFLDKESQITIIPHGRLRCNCGTSVGNAALSGLGICQLPEYYVNEHLRTGRLSILLSGFRAPPEPIWAVSPTRRIGIPKIQKLIQTIEEKFSVELA